MHALPDEWSRLLCQWASKNDSVRELWLFGSRAGGTSHPDSDVDIGIGLMPPTGSLIGHSETFARSGINGPAS